RNFRCRSCSSARARASPTWRRSTPGTSWSRCWRRST
ncbi:uncharacterized protein METZ01_LOCUS292355, partial [marine metagenome]